MTLRTNLPHLETKAAYEELIKNNTSVMIACGRMGPMCLPVYAAMEKLRDEYSNIKFYDMDFDSEVGMETIRSLPQTQSFTGLPFVVYFKNGEPASASTSIQTVDQVRTHLNKIK